MLRSAFRFCIFECMVNPVINDPTVAVNVFENALYDDLDNAL